MYRYESDHKEGWVLQNWCFQTAMLEKTLESSLNSKEIKALNPKGNQPWIIIERTVAEAEAPVFWSSDANSWLIRKVSDAGKDWRQKEKRTSGDGWMASLMQWTWTWANIRRWWGTGTWCAAVQEIAKSWTQLGDWRTATVSTGMENIYGGAMWIEGEFSFGLDM